MLSALHKKLESKVEKLKYKNYEVVQARIKNKSELPTRELKFYSRGWLIQSIIY